MTTRTELLEIINNGENSGVEFKRDTLQNLDLAKELVAFSNLVGGRILLGVEDDGGISGITRGNLEEWVMTTCRDKIRPAIIPFYEIVRDVEPGKDVAVVQVTRGFDVHSLWHQHGNRYYIRVGSQSREAAQEELRRLFQQRGAIRAELRPVSGAVMSDLDRRRLQDYFHRIREQEVPAENDETGWETLLVNTEIMTEEGVGVGGILLFGKTPNRFLPHAGIDAAAFLETEKDYAARERKALRGPMTPLLDANGEIVENGLVEQALEFVCRNAPGTTRLEGGRRAEKPAYPRDVLREGIVNALIHRDYLLTGTDVELSLYGDRLEIISPGRLPNGVTPERMRAGTRAYRNHLLREVLHDYGYLEHMGMGIPRKIIVGMQKHNGTEPELIEDGERFILRLSGVPEEVLNESVRDR